MAARPGLRWGLGGVVLLLLGLTLMLVPDDPPPAAPAVPPAARVAAAAPAPAPAPAPDLSGLRLHGLLASGAIIGFTDGGQRLVPIGREALPGLVLRRIEQQHAVLASAGGEARLGFDGAASAPPAAPAIASAEEPAEREQSLRYRLGLAPLRVGSRVRGYRVRPGADLPVLARAGIRPGDTILGVNGSIFDEERMLELAWTAANSSRTEFEVERGGRRILLTLQGRADVTER
jgi:type II secretion system protein C